MVDSAQKPPQQHIVELYTSIVSERHPDLVAAWPVISGYNTKIATFQGWLIFVLNHTGNTAYTTSSGLGELNSGLVGVSSIDQGSKQRVRDHLVALSHRMPSSWFHQAETYKKI